MGKYDILVGYKSSWGDGVLFNRGENQVWGADSPRGFFEGRWRWCELSIPFRAIGCTPLQQNLFFFRTERTIVLEFPMWLRGVPRRHRFIAHDFCDHLGMCTGVFKADQ